MPPEHCAASFFKVIVASVLRSAGGAQPPLPHESVPEVQRGKCCVACDLDAGRWCYVCAVTEPCCGFNVKLSDMQVSAAFWEFLCN